MFSRIASAFVLLLLSATIASAQAHISKRPHANPKQAVASAAIAQPMSISGLASSGRNCIGNSGSGVHPLGWVPDRSRVRITFSSDFDPIASATVIRLGEAAPDGFAEGYDMSDDDSGGGTDPRIDETVPFAGILMLVVSPYWSVGPGGCYFYKVEITTP